MLGEDDEDGAVEDTRADVWGKKNTEAVYRVFRGKTH